MLLSLLDRDETKTHPQFRLKLKAVGFGVFIPIFSVTSGLTFDLSALFASSSTIARVPLFLLGILLLARGLPMLVYVRLLGLSRSLIARILQATSLPFIVAATQIGLQFGVVSRASAAGLVAAGLLSVVISPALGLALRRRERPETAALDALPTAVMRVLTAEDRRSAAPATSSRRHEARNCPSSAKTRSNRDHRRKPQIEPRLPYCQPSRSRHRKLFLPERAGSSGIACEPSTFPDPESSDKPSDYALRQHQTGGDVSRHRYPSGLR